jgi:hypothetical protein
LNCTVSRILLILATATAGWLLAFNVALAKDKTYINDKYGYSIDYPPFLKPEGEPDAHDGQKFSSPQSPFKMSVWGTYSNWLSGDEMSLAQQLDWSLKNLSTDELPAAKVTYKTRGKNWFVISGNSKNKIFYERTNKGKDTFVTVLFTYPAAQKAKFDSLVQRIAASIKAGGS